MLLGILKEQNFNRVSITPTASKKLTAMGITAVVEAGAGEKAGYPDQIYQESDIKSTSRDNILKDADIIISIEPMRIL